MSMLEQLTHRDRVFDFLAPVASPVDVRHGPILYMEGVNVSFDGFKAINNLNLTVDDGELRCIIGPNGAGKTTMMDIITGKTRPDTGSVWFGSRHNLLTKNEPDIASLGIGRKFQKPTVFEALTVFENLELAMAADKRILPTLTAVMKPEYRDRIDEVLETINLAAIGNRLAGILSHGQKQWLEIGMLLIQKPDLLMLDEPVAGMSVAERKKTAELLRVITRDHTVLVIEHDMQFVGDIADRVTVMHQGKVLSEGSIDHVKQDPKVIEVYLGH
ncbi:MAG: urea ABC transporter ATP-binding protein UrtD [Marinobacter sp.]|uniref:urea ABC transporter ATP-binding protein UrtD n=1 Tax=Marinobacter sp. TaxID=50741 RepID=UPI003297B702